jgi:hypothetical protein
MNFARLVGLLLVMALAMAGCERDGTPPMGIQTDATTQNPPTFDRQIPDEAVRNGDVRQRISEPVAGAERDGLGPAQEESLEGAYNLEDFRGRPVLLVFAGSPDVPAYERLRAAWRENEARLQDRNVALVESLLRGNSPEATKSLAGGESQVMRSRYGVQPPEFKLYVINEQGEAIAQGGEEMTLDAVLESLTEGDQQPPTSSP